MTDFKEATFTLARQVIPVEAFVCKDTYVAIRGQQYDYLLAPAGLSHVFTKRGARVAASCIIVGDCSWWDKVIAEYLLIKNNEQRYLDIAILSPRVGLTWDMSIKAYSDATPWWGIVSGSVAAMGTALGIWALIHFTLR